MDSASANRCPAHRPADRLGLLEDLTEYLLTGHGDVEPLTDVDPPELRLRLGDYRVRFYDHGDWIEVLRVSHRKEAYRWVLSFGPAQHD